MLYLAKTRRPECEKLFFPIILLEPPERSIVGKSFSFTLRCFWSLGGCSSAFASSYFSIQVKSGARHMTEHRVEFRIK